MTTRTTLESLMKLHVANWRLLLASLALSAVVVAPAFAGRADSSVRDAIASGKTARVILQYASTAERDAAFNRLLDRGAAVRAVDTEAGPALVVLGSPAAFGAEVEAAAHAASGRRSFTNRFFVTRTLARRLQGAPGQLFCRAKWTSALSTSIFPTT